jgi:alpha-beta hydrolase superfamily lysophospholipase
MDTALQFINQRKKYSEKVLYGHSTGGLIAIYYLKHGQHASQFQKLILNGPFLNWNKGWQNILLHNIVWVPLTWQLNQQQVSFCQNFFSFNPLFEAAPGGKPNEYTIELRKHYAFDFAYKYNKEIPVQAGWIRAVSEVMSEIQSNNIKLNIPMLLLYGEQDSVLNPVDMTTYGPMLAKDIKIQEIKGGNHDILANFDKALNLVSWKYIVEFLG